METRIPVQEKQLWSFNNDRNPRTIRILLVDGYRAEVCNVVTDRVTHIDIRQLGRRGRHGWTLIGTNDDPPPKPPVQARQTYQDCREERQGVTRYIQVIDVGRKRVSCVAWRENPRTPGRATDLAIDTLLGPEYRLVDYPDVVEVDVW